MLCIGAQIVGERVALEIVRSFVAAEHDHSEEFLRRVAKLADMERDAARSIAAGDSA